MQNSYPCLQISTCHSSNIHYLAFPQLLYSSRCDLLLVHLKTQFSLILESLKMPSFSMWDCLPRFLDGDFSAMYQFSAEYPFLGNVLEIIQAKAKSHDQYQMTSSHPYFYLYIIIWHRNFYNCCL